MVYIFSAIMVLCVVAVVAAAVLYFCSRRFAVNEDGRVALVVGALPGANCGGCGFAGCAGFASALVAAADEGLTRGLWCPVGGGETMRRIADLLGTTADEGAATTAVVRCNGSCGVRERTARYDGLKTCFAMHACGMGDTGCGYGCLGCGDCVRACAFGALSMSDVSGLPVVDMERCTGCGRCVDGCPRGIIGLRRRRAGNRLVAVRCVNRDRGAVAVRACSSACIGCGKCVKVCAFDAVTVKNNLSWIDDEKCRLCRKCEAACPTGAVFAFNFPQRKTEV